MPNAALDSINARVLNVAEQSGGGVQWMELPPLEWRTGTRRAATAERNLILVHRRGAQEIGDFAEVRDRVTEIAPDIEVFIADNQSRCSVTRRQASHRPTLVFSPTALETFRPARGKIYQGHSMTKMAQVERLQAAGLPVPKSTVLTPETKLDTAEWGEFVILKPMLPQFQSQGKGISLMCTTDVRYKAPEEYPWNHPGRYSPFVVQRYVHTGPAISNIRVLTLFGEPLYALEGKSKIDTVELSADYVRSQDCIVAHQGLKAEQKIVNFVNDKDVLDLARATYAACPDAALQACDILRDARDGRLYVLEFNPGGNTWHFSSARTRMTREGFQQDEVQRFAEKRRSQFDAFRTAARVLVDRTRLEAA